MPKHFGFVDPPPVSRREPERADRSSYSAVDYKVCALYRRVVAINGHNLLGLSALDGAAKATKEYGTASLGLAIGKLATPYGSLILPKGSLVNAITHSSRRQYPTPKELSVMLAEALPSSSQESLTLPAIGVNGEGPIDSIFCLTLGEHPAIHNERQSSRNVLLSAIGGIIKTPSRIPDVTLWMAQKRLGPPELEQLGEVLGEHLSISKTVVTLDRVQPVPATMAAWDK